MRTAEELEDSLDQDLAWRRFEMQAILTQVRNTSGATQEAMARAGIALLYAHWEGYSKHALTQYLRFVSRRRLKMKELYAGFVGLAIEAELKRGPAVSAEQRRNLMVRRLLESGDDRPHVPSREINTRSNLTSELCHELYDTLGLDVAPFATKATLIDYKLLRSRNEIAHGRWSTIAPADYETLHDDVLIMISTVRNVVMTAADNGHYRRV